MMLALSLWQPYADLIVHGYKKYETRSWTTAYRGVMMIHAAKKWDIALQQETERLSQKFAVISAHLGRELPLGCIVGAVELVAIHRAEELRDSLSPLELGVGNFATGRFAWEMKVVKIPPAPIPAKGKQGLWRWETSI